MYHRPVRFALLHGFAGDPRNWDATRAHLPDAEAIALPPPAPWDDYLDRIAPLVENARVVGYSLGARLALGLFATGRIAPPILISVNPGIDDADRPARRAADAAWAAMLRTEGIDAFFDAWERQPLFVDQPRDPDRRARRAALDPEQLARSLEYLGLAEMPDYRSHVGACRLIVGARDAKFVAIARATGAPFQTLDSGHDPTLEQPRDLASLLLG